MTNESGLCAVCGGAKEAGTTTFTVDLKFGAVVVRDVPALVCTTCGDAWIPDDVAAKLEQVIDEARQRQTAVEVTRWAQIAA